ncbi:ATP-binding domain-containing protein [Pedobacter sp. HMF7647]|uniref:ATP-binding domain-containing protein n=1 Tax=Hufsiella arboris TaxID=2695275 RepID=A0A7K1Y6Z3_9SPHI|nr:ATP-binding protein [Hufsiella arboris]MXV50343.1 ATP-binding domain-containing protein [Hufsiella arboris]
MNHQQSILSFWKDIEIFALPELPADAKAINLDKPLPWELPFTPRPNSTWRHTIFFGKHSKEKIIGVIEKAIGDYTEKPDWLQKPTGNTCMAVLILDEEGRLSGDSPYLQASYLHGIKCLQDGRYLSGVNSRLDAIQEEFKERHPYSQDAASLENMSSPVFTRSHLKNEVAVLNRLNIKDVLCDAQVYVQSAQVSRLVKGDTAFLNSFYLNDLDRLITDSAPFGKGLAGYLSKDVKLDGRIDLLSDADTFFQTLDPAKMPAGRWPSDPAQGLYTAQLGAVDTSLSLLETEGIIGINGPPGTGKTTLLADVIAEIVVLRAQKLAQTNSSNLFGKGERIERESGRFSYYFPVQSGVFDDAGIVVASNNNAAVENISKELPDVRKIDRIAFPGAGYFTEYSQNLIKGESWGLLAAALGNAENRAAFKNEVWYDYEGKPGFSTALQSLYNNPEKVDRTVDFVEPYQETKTEFEDLLKELNEFKRFAGEFHRLLPGFLKDQKLTVKLEKEIGLLTKSIKPLRENRQGLTEGLSALQEQIAEARNAIRLHESVKPGFFFFQKLFKSGPFEAWNKIFLPLVNDYSELSARRSSLQKELEALDAGIAGKEKEQVALQEKLDKVKQNIRVYNGKTEELHERYEIAYEDIPGEKLLVAFKSDKKAFHKANTWSSAKLNRLRSELFLKGLKLHEYAVLRNAKEFKNNISLLLDLMDGKVLVDKRMAPGLWRSLFFCIPVVSTSLASVSRLFGSLGKESIGWLLLDEAGQATPQSAAGMIYRSKRSVIIGDPLQIEPVVTTPEKLISVLNGPYEIDPLWSPLRGSAQMLADRVTATGTWMKQGDADEAIWTGFPLRTHRRCNNPMFDLSNEIAYGGQMVKAVDDIPFDCPLGPSGWFDVEGVTIYNKQVVEEELVLLKEKIRLLGKEREGVFVISPFKAVADRCRQELQVINLKVLCGTIHTFQGKEADIVFLVLGSDPARPGSRQWASQKPNMLNVALTRARRRFYVIGSKKGWKGYPFFSVLAGKL